MPRRFRDRADAGRQLAAALAHYAGREDEVVPALPRGAAAAALRAQHPMR